MGSSDFVGRRADLAELEAVLTRTVAGRGELVLVPGEAGIGKTRLAEEVCRRAGSLGMQVAWAGCSEAEITPAFWPWTQVLLSLARASDAPAPPRPLGQLSSALGGVPPADAAVDPEVARQELFEAVAFYVRTTAASRPLLVVIDDLHWADAPSVRLLTFVAAVLRASPVTLLGTYRDLDADPQAPFAAAVPDLVRHGRQLALSGLETAEVAGLVATLTGSEPQPGTAGALRRHTGGNPLFVRELVRLLAGRGELDHIQSREPDLASLPEGVVGVLRRRLSTVSDGCRHWLGTGSGLGREFAADVVAEAMGRPEGGWLEWADEAVRARVIHQVGLGRYAFGHALIRSVVYDDLGLPRRVRLHQQLGEALEGRQARGLPVDPADLAQHFLLAAPGGNAAKAVRYATLAGDRAMEMLAYEEAVRLYEQALDGLHLDPGAADRAELLLRLGEARTAVGDSRGARDAFEDAVGLARDAGRADALARAALGLGSGPSGFEVPLHDRRQVELLEDALVRLPEEPAALRARVMARLSVAVSYSATAQRRIELAEKAVELSRQVGDRAVLAYALAAHCDAIAGPFDVEVRRREATEIIELASTLEDRAMELLGRRLRLVAHLESGDTSAAESEIAAFARVADTLRQPLYLWYVPLWRGMKSLMAGRFDDCERAAAEAAAIGARASSANARMLVESQRWTLARERGRYAQMLAVLEGMFGLVSDLGPEGWVAMALSYGFAGRRAEAVALLDRAAAGELPEQPSTAEWLPTLVLVADLVGLVGGHPVASTAYRLLLPHRARFAIDGIGAASFGSVERALGILAAVEGHRDAAAEHFDAALAADRRAGGALLVAHTLRDAGRFLGDTRRLAEARSLYDGLGLTHQVDAVDALLGEAVPPAPAGARAGNVFRRDGELWTLAFAGKAVHLKDAKGLHDLATLLARPGHEVHVFDLAGVASGAATGRAAAEGLHEPGHLGEVLDEEARRRYRARLEELEALVAEAETSGDSERAARARAERDFLVDELTAAFGLGGRPRRSGDPVERARSAVTQRIRGVLARIEEAHPDLGRHLRRSVRTGTFCAYDPAEPVAWDLTP